MSPSSSGFHRAWRSLADSIKSHDWEIIRRATKKLADMRDPRCISLLLPPLLREDDFYREAAVWILSRFHPTPMVRDFLLHKLESGNAKQKLRVLEALEDLPFYEALPRLKRLAGETNRDLSLRRAALGAISRLVTMDLRTSKSVYDLFLEAARHSDPKLRICGLEGLYGMKNMPFQKEILRMLKASTRDPDPLIRKAYAARWLEKGAHDRRFR